MAKLSDTASADSRRRSCTASRWKRGIDADITAKPSMAFEIVERLATILAAPQRLAGSRSEFGEHLGIVRAALRTGHLLDAEQSAAGACGPRRRDAIFLELAPAVFAHPIGGPGRRQHGVHLGVADTRTLQRHLDL